MTRAAIEAHAADVEWVSEERIGSEVRRMLAAPTPSRAVELMAATGILATTLPELEQLPADATRRALATLDLYEREDVLGNVAALQRVAAERLEEMAARFELIDEGAPEGRLLVDAELAHHGVEAAALLGDGVVGRLGVVPLAALGVGTVLLSSVYWIFNFLGIGTQTEVARAAGGGQGQSARSMVGASGPPDAPAMGQEART